MSDLDRIREQFEALDGDARYRSRHGDESLAHRLILEERSHVAAEMLAAAGLETLAGRTVLDAGCGAGDSLRSLPGIEVARLVLGADVVQSRLERAAGRVSGGCFVLTDVGTLALADESVDLVLLFTLFSSLPTSGDIPRVAREVVRVLRPGGLALIYDFRRFPGFGADGGLAPGEVEALFTGCEVASKRVTLAPPIARRVASVSSTLFELLRSVPALRTHDLHCVRKPGAEDAEDAESTEEDG